MLKFNEFLILEGKTFKDLNEDVCLFIKQYEHSEGCKPLICMYLYNKEDIIGMIVIGKSDKKSLTPYQSFKIKKSAVNEKYKGYGPILYDIALQVAGDNGIMPDRNISNSARAIWEYYFYKRNDVTKKPIDNYNNPLTIDIKDDGKIIKPYSIFGSNIRPLDINQTSYINHVYYLSGQDYQKLVSRHNNSIEFENDLEARGNLLFRQRMGYST